MIRTKHGSRCYGIEKENCGLFGLLSVWRVWYWQIPHADYCLPKQYNTDEEAIEAMHQFIDEYEEWARNHYHDMSSSPPNHNEVRDDQSIRV
jgi:hypothetical protein